MDRVLMSISGRPAFAGYWVDAGVSRGPVGAGVLRRKRVGPTTHTSEGVDMDRAAEKTAGAGVEAAPDEVSELEGAATGGGVAPKHDPLLASVDDREPVYRIINT